MTGAITGKSSVGVNLKNWKIIMDDFCGGCGGEDKTVGDPCLPMSYVGEQAFFDSENRQDYWILKK